MARGPDGGTIPTPKGVTMKAESLPKLIGLLRQAHSTAVEAGWCSANDA